MRVVGLIFAYISLILLILMCSKVFTKRINKFKKVNVFLTKKHILISISFLVSFIIHVVCSTTGDFSLYSAKISIVCLVLSIVFALFIKKKPKVFLKLHYIFSILCLIFAVVHIIEVNVL